MIFSGRISNLDYILNTEQELKLSTSEDFAHYVKHPNTVDALLVDPFEKTWHKVALPLQIKVDESEVLTVFLEHAMHNQ